MRWAAGLPRPSRVVALAAVAGSAGGANLLALHGAGLAAVPPAAGRLLTAALELAIVLTVAHEASQHGFASARARWVRHGRRVLLLISVALALRGVAVAAAGRALGLAAAPLLGAAVTATDPIGILVIGALVAELTRAPVLNELFWVLTMESVVNDAVSRVVYAGAAGAAPPAIAGLLLVTLGSGAVLAAADGTLRAMLRQRRATAGVEVAAMLILYLAAAVATMRLGGSAIGAAVFGALLGDALLHRRQPPAARAADPRWGFAALLLAEALVVLTLPFVTLTPGRIAIGAVLLAAIVAARGLWDGLDQLLQRRRGTPANPGLAGASTLLAATLLGVPSLNAASAFLDGAVEAADILSAVIVVSWVVALPTSLWLLRRVAAPREPSANVRRPRRGGRRQASVVCFGNGRGGASGRSGD